MIIPETIKKIVHNSGEMGDTWCMNHNKELYKIVNHSDVEIFAGSYLEICNGWYSQQFSGGERYTTIPGKTTAYKHYKIRYVTEGVVTDMDGFLGDFGYGEEV